MLRGFATLLLGAIVSATAASGRLRLTVTVTKVTDEARPRYALYRGVLHNDGPDPVLLDLAQMPGGFAGKATLFLCSVEKWNEGKHEWKVAYKNYPDQTNQTATVAPGKELEVCVVPLPGMEVQDGDTVRLSLRLLKSNAKADAVSSAFIAGQDIHLGEK